MKYEKQTKAKRSLIDAFNGLALERPYSEFHVVDIIAAADVSRSTFYEHFSNKEGILRDSLGGLTKMISSAGFEDCDQEHLASLLVHFREVGELAKVYLQTEMSFVITELLTEQVALRLGGKATQGMPTALLARQVAEASMGLIRGWLFDEYSGEVCPKVIAKRLHDSAEKLLDS